MPYAAPLSKPGWVCYGSCFLGHRSSTNELGTQDSRTPKLKLEDWGLKYRTNILRFFLYTRIDIFILFYNFTNFVWVIIFCDNTFFFTWVLNTKYAASWVKWIWNSLWWCDCRTVWWRDCCWSRLLIRNSTWRRCVSGHPWQPVQ